MRGGHARCARGARRARRLRAHQHRQCVICCGQRWSGRHSVDILAPHGVRPVEAADGARGPAAQRPHVRLRAARAGARALLGRRAAPRPQVRGAHAGRLLAQAQRRAAPAAAPPPPTIPA
ncbi:hypothetical protein JYU34_008840 [Plutella xylostella]|uniref:Uncharacterized protein n=1 Tax=Plutella xylostella TaxID=51655 RepID=A0ABQ7QM30_PLUXY|nr:hypothetical protein JYU34_008840 [Plutella xylostella]